MVYIHLKTKVRTDHGLRQNQIKSINPFQEQASIGPAIDPYELRICYAAASW